MNGYDQNYWNGVAWKFPDEVIRHGFEGNRSCNYAVVASNGFEARHDGNVGFAESALFILARQVSDVIVERDHATREFGPNVVSAKGLD